MSRPTRHGGRLPPTRVLRGAAPAMLLVIVLATRALAGPAPSDSLAWQVVPLEARAHLVLRAWTREGRVAPDSVGERGKSIVLAMLRDAEAACRSNLLPKEEEPGSPWLAWRALGRCQDDSCTWYAAALACADSLCGHELVLHDRLALLAIGTRRSRMYLFPLRAPTIADESCAFVDSVTFLRGAGYTLVQARRSEDNDHPCWGGGDPYSASEAQFVVLRGDSIVQAFALEASSERVSHDDESGDGGTTVTGTLHASAATIELSRRTDDWQEAPDGDPKKTRHDLHGEVIRLEYRPAAGRFVRTR